MANSKPASFKTSVIRDLTEAQSCIRFTEAERKGELRANSLKDYQKHYSETGRLLDRALGYVCAATGKVEASNVILVPGEDHTTQRLEKFRRLDLNGDGRVTPEEFIAAEILEAA